MDVRHSVNGTLLSQRAPRYVFMLLTWRAGQQDTLVERVLDLCLGS